jgi:hypothetical protein
MTTCVYTFEIPDLSRPIANATDMSPSGELMPFHPAPLDPAQVIGRRIDDVAINAGTYGMGGPGFFALRLSGDWLVIAIWGAASWMTCQGRLIDDLFFDTGNRGTPWIVGGDSIEPICYALNGQTVDSITLTRDAMHIAISDGLDLTIDADPAKRPVFAGNGRPRAFAPDDDLRRAVFLSPTTELWV